MSLSHIIVNWHKTCRANSHDFVNVALVLTAVIDWFNTHEWDGLVVATGNNGVEPLLIHVNKNKLNLLSETSSRIPKYPERLRPILSALSRLFVKQREDAG